MNLYGIIFIFELECYTTPAFRELLYINHHGMEMEAPGNCWRMVCCNAQYSTVQYCTVRSQ